MTPVNLMQQQNEEVAKKNSTPETLSIQFSNWNRIVGRTDVKTYHWYRNDTDLFDNPKYSHYTHLDMVLRSYLMTYAIREPNTHKSSGVYQLNIAHCMAKLRVKNCRLMESLENLRKSGELTFSAYAPRTLQDSTEQIHNNTVPYISNSNIPIDNDKDKDIGKTMTIDNDKDNAKDISMTVDKALNDRMNLLREQADAIAAMEKNEKEKNTDELLSVMSVQKPESITEPETVAVPVIENFVDTGKTMVENPNMGNGIEGFDSENQTQTVSATELKPMSEAISSLLPKEIPQSHTVQEPKSEELKKTIFQREAEDVLTDTNRPLTSSEQDIAFEKTCEKHPKVGDFSERCKAKEVFKQNITTTHELSMFRIGLRNYLSENSKTELQYIKSLRYFIFYSDKIKGPVRLWKEIFDLRHEKKAKSSYNQSSFVKKDIESSNENSDPDALRAPYFDSKKFEEQMKLDTSEGLGLDAEIIAKARELFGIDLSRYSKKGKDQNIAK